MYQRCVNGSSGGGSIEVYNFPRITFSTPYQSSAGVIYYAILGTILCPSVQAEYSPSVSANYIAFEYLDSVAINKLNFTTQYSSSYGNHMYAFEVQYSDDGETWTTAYTESANTLITYEITFSAGSHKHWRVANMRTQKGSYRYYAAHSDLWFYT